METSGHFVCRAHFFYDQSGKVAKATHNGSHYAYLYNMQGDVVGIVDSAGTEVVKYTYDAWGRLLSKTGTMASTLGTLNPFRYRGYVYDEETGLYYLRSRYYNPTWGRFVNADSLVTGNLYTYCLCSPIKLIDPSGRCFVVVGYAEDPVEEGAHIPQIVVDGDGAYENLQNPH